jgi:hypothetical protein
LPDIHVFAKGRIKVKERIQKEMEERRRRKTEGDR